MSQYCCFMCPQKNEYENNLTDLCPVCGKGYDFILTYYPENIREYKVEKPLARGFYGATYISTFGMAKQKRVLKISPVNFYSFFDKKSFEEEVVLHAELAEYAQHVVKIHDGFEEDIVFSDGTKIRCYVSVLDYIDGCLLDDYLNGSEDVTPDIVYQIACDLFAMRDEFEIKKLNHNDLHSGNIIIEKLPISNMRSRSIHDSIRVRAIDLGSLADHSKSTDTRLGDIQSIAIHIDMLLSKMLEFPEKMGDRDYRTALALQGIVRDLSTKREKTRLPKWKDLVEIVESTYFDTVHHWRPWEKEISLKTLSDHYNAQTLESCHVPKLLVDPEGRWVSILSKPGPQIITGMRGCGKTMLLRALDIHARASKVNDNETNPSIAERIKQDKYVGLFVSAQKLLDIRDSSASLDVQITKLFVAYALCAARALLHVSRIDSECIAPNACDLLSDGIAACLNDGSMLQGVLNLQGLDSKLEKMVLHLSRNDSSILIAAAPETIFQNLASLIKSACSLFKDSSVFYLLDDVSTRYLNIAQIKDIISVLLFQNPNCAFKLTSEWQTFALGLLSPGKQHPLRIGRDIDSFDLGADVLQTIKSTSGKEFVESILTQRTRYYVKTIRNPNPREFLGDISLEDIAQEIAASGSNSSSRKNVYRGFSCLSHVCVGDIGDILILYETLVQRGKSQKSILLSQKIQAECFQNLCAWRLYDLHGRGVGLKDHALAFSKAAHTLLIRSYKEMVKNQRGRLRQYSLIYVRMTTEDKKKLKDQMDMLRELIDAGVFVYAGGAPRTKTRDANPLQYFKLCFRKVYGLSSYIGLSDRDRFELSGEELEAWLTKPEEAVTILLRNQVQDDSTTLFDDEATPLVQQVSGESVKYETLPLGLPGLYGEAKAPEPQHATLRNSDTVPLPINVKVRILSHDECNNLSIDAILTGLGFEDRTQASNEFLANHFYPKNVYAVRYKQKGKDKKIIKTWNDAGLNVDEIKYCDALDGVSSAGYIGSSSLIDISGLTKPLIFSAVREALISKRKVYVCYASALYHYPLQTDIDRLFSLEKSKDPLFFLQELSSLLKGESGPYTEIPLINEEVDFSRNRSLLAFASAKHERLFSLLDKRTYDSIEIVTQDGNRSRGRVARIAAEVLAKNYKSTYVSTVKKDDLSEILAHLDKSYLNMYSKNGANVELGLTGSKIQAVAAAILGVKRKLSQVWYLSPRIFDARKFSRGAGEIRIYEIALM